MQANVPVRAFIGIGANLADPQANVRRAIAAIAAMADSRVVATSSLYRTAPVGRLDQPDFVNAVTELETGLDAEALLEAAFHLGVLQTFVGLFLFVMTGDVVSAEQERTDFEANACCNNCRSGTLRFDTDDQALTRFIDFRALAVSCVGRIHHTSM